MQGLGISFRPEFLSFWDDIYSVVDCFEFIPDEIVYNERLFRDTFEALGDKPRMAHSTALSLGSIEKLEGAFLDSLVNVTKQMKANALSDHMSFRRAHGIEIENFCLPLDDAVSLEVLKGNINYYEEKFGMKILLENITVNGLMNKNDFMIRETGIFRYHSNNGGEILLDVNNFYLNAKNFSCNLFRYINEFPLDAVRGIHIAGHEEAEGWLVDSHMNRVSDEVLELLRTVLARSPAEYVILERDNDSATRDEILEDLERIANIWCAARR